MKWYPPVFVLAESYIYILSIGNLCPTKVTMSVKGLVLFIVNRACKQTWGWCLLALSLLFYKRLLANRKTTSINNASSMWNGSRVGKEVSFDRCLEWQLYPAGKSCWFDTSFSWNNSKLMTIRNRVFTWYHLIIGSPLTIPMQNICAKFVHFLCQQSFRIWVWC